MEAYRVWASLDLKGDATKKMTAFARSIDRADKILPKLQSKVNFFAKSLKVINDTLIKVNPQFKAFISEFKVLSSVLPKVNAGFNRLTNLIDGTNSITMFFTSSLERISEELGRVAVETKAATESLMELKRVGKIRTSIGISKAGLVEGAAAQRITGKSAKSSGSSYHLNHGILRKIGGEAASSGGLIAGAGAMGGPAFGLAVGVGMTQYHGFHQQVEYEKLLTQLKSRGSFNPQQMKEIQSLTTQIIPGISPVNQLEAFNDAYMATLRFPDAKMLAPTLAKFKFVADSTYGGLTSGQLKDAIRVAELRGGADPVKMMDQLNTVMKMYSLSGGTLNPSQIKSFLNRATASGFHISNAGLLAMEPTMQEIPAQSVGFGLRTFSNMMVAGTGLSNKKAAFLQSVGLLDQNGNFPKKYRTTLAKDPEAFMEKIVLPLFAKAGINSPQEITDAFMNFGSTPGNLFAAMYKNIPKSQRARAQAGSIFNIDQMSQAAFQSEAGAALRVSQAFDTFSNALARLSSPLTIGVLNSLSNYLDHASEILTGKVTIIPSGKDFKTIGSKMWEMMTFQNVGKKAHPLTITPNQYQILAEQFPGAVLGSGSGNSKVGDVYLDHEKVGHVIHRNMANSINRGGTISGSTGSNSSVAPVPVGVNYYGGYN